MSLLSPWFLAGLALVAGPIIAHLIRRATRDRISFSGMRFLSASAPRLDRRSRVQHPLLLALRMLILALLALAFARPYFETDSPLAPSVNPPRHVIAILDTSASMHRDGLWSQAQDRVRAIVDELSEQDDFTLLLAGTSVQPTLNAEAWRMNPPDERKALLDAALAGSAAPGWSAFHLDHAVRVALETHQELSAQLEGDPSAPAIHIISDFSEGSRISGLASVAWPAGVSVNLDQVEAATNANVALQWLGWGVANETESTPPARLRLIASPDTPTTSVSIKLLDPSNDTPLGSSITQVVARGGTATVLLPIPLNAPPTMSVQLEGDGVDFDNRLWIVRPSPRDLPVILLGSEQADDSTNAAYYLRRAIAGWTDPLPRVATNLPAFDASGLPPLIVAAGLPNLDSATQLRERINRGATLLVLANNQLAVRSVAELLDESGWSASQVTSGSTSGYALLGKIDFGHPLFLPFSDPRFSDFSRIRFWSHPRIDLPAGSAAQIVARYDDESPAVVEASIGSGRLVVWAGNWTPAESQWVLSSKFVPWLQALAERTAGGPLRASITGLDQLDRLGPYNALSSLNQIETTDLAPGLYQLSRDGYPTREVALNVPDNESDLTPLDLDVFTPLGVPLEQVVNATAATESQRRNEAVNLTESRQKIWRWLLLAAALFLALESVLSLRIARRLSAAT